MKPDIRHKTQSLGRHIPGFLGYSAIHYGETDLLLRRHLVGELEKVRDRLADYLASHPPDDPEREPLARLLQGVARFREGILSDIHSPARETGSAPPDEERLLNFDLALLDKVAGLCTPLDALETAGSAQQVAGAAGLLAVGLAEAEELYRERRLVFSGQGD